MTALRRYAEAPAPEVSMRRDAPWAPAFAFVALLMCAAAVGQDGPIVTTARFSTQDAREVTPVDHGRTGQNARVDWSIIAPAKGGSDALYFFTSKLRDDTSEPTPIMSWLDLKSGTLRELYGGDRVKLKRKARGGAEDDLGMLAPEPAGDLAVSWSWGRPCCGVRGRGNTLYVGTRAAGPKAPRGSNAILAYDCRQETFEELAILRNAPVAISHARGSLWIITANGEVSRYDELEGLQSVDRLPFDCSQGLGVQSGADGVLYVAFGPPPVRLYVLKLSRNAATAARLLPEVTIEGIQLHRNIPHPWCEIVVGEDGHFRTERYALREGRAEKLNGPPDTSKLVEARGYELRTDWHDHPLRVSVRRPGEEWRHLPVEMKRAAWDTIRTIRGGPQGRYLYGAGWPTAWVWRFDPETGRFRTLGRHYNIYEMQPWRDEMWATAYYGIKFLRWHPEEPWTYDEERHWANKTYPMHSSPWGDKGVSNPRLVCRFRYLKKLFVRRSGGMVVTENGEVWIGARTPAVEYWRSRYGGAVNWYDQATETIGQVREPFLHHSVRDICRAGPHHIAAAGSRYISPYEPLPEDFSPGKFVLIDRRTRKAVLDMSPLGAPLSYCEEGEPGRVVFAGYAGRYGGEGIRGAIGIFDMEEMRVTHVVRLPVKLVWTEYDNLLRFERGPDKRIYFYARDEDGVALCRIDSRTAKVEPVLRGPQITDVAGYVNLGASFCFFKDRVWFGAKRLVSLPVEAVVGGAKGGAE